MQKWSLSLIKNIYTKLSASLHLAFTCSLDDPITSGDMYRLFQLLRLAGQNNLFSAFFEPSAHYYENKYHVLHWWGMFLLRPCQSHIRTSPWQVVWSDDNASWWLFTLVFIAVHLWSHHPRCMLMRAVNRVTVINEKSKAFLPLTQHEQNSLHLSLLGSRIKLARVEPQFLLPGNQKQFDLILFDVLLTAESYVITLGRAKANKTGTILSCSEKFSVTCIFIHCLLL